MMILKIEAESNGARANQSSNGTEFAVPEGWLRVPEELEAQCREVLPWADIVLEDGKISSVSENAAAKAVWEAAQAAAEENGGEE